MPAYDGVPGFVEEVEAHGETTVVVERERVADAARHLRDQAGFNFLSDVTSADYLGWSDEAPAGYWGSSRGRDLNSPGTAGLHRLPEPKPRRFAVSYHLLALCSEPRRIRSRSSCPGRART